MAHIPMSDDDYEKPKIFQAGQKVWAHLPNNPWSHGVYERIGAGKIYCHLITLDAKAVTISSTGTVTSTFSFSNSEVLTEEEYTKLTLAL